MAKKIAVAIHKGGVGKTTTAKNLAAALALTGKRTLLVDLDEQANATKGLGFKPDELSLTVNDLFARSDVEPLGVILRTKVEGFHLLPAHPDLAKTQAGMAYQRATDPDADPRTILRDILNPLEAAYDYIIFDTPPAMDYLTLNALAAADELLIPAAASAYSEDGVLRTWEAYERAVQTYNPRLRRPRILITKVKPTLAAGNVLEGITEEYLDAVIDQLIPESTRVDRAEQLRMTVIVYDPNDKAALAYKRVAELLIHD